MNARIESRTEVASDLMVLRVTPEERLPFLPGQFVSLGMKVGDRLLHRAYSIVSAPSEPYLEFFIERVPNGNLTPLLWEANVGDTLQLISRAAGVLTLNPGPKHHLFLATVTGAAPFISMLRNEKIIREEGIGTPANFLLIHGASHPEEFGPYREELEALAEKDWFTYVPTVSRTWEASDWTREIGRVEDVIRKHSDPLGFTTASTESYVCGHPEMVRTAEQVLLRAGLPAHRISTEQYFRLPS